MNEDMQEVQDQKAMTIRYLQERIDGILPHLSSIENQLDFQVHGASKEMESPVTKDMPKGATPNLNTLHAAIAIVENRTRKIHELLGSLIGN